MLAIKFFISKMHSQSRKKIKFFKKLVHFILLKLSLHCSWYDYESGVGLCKFFFFCIPLIIIKKKPFKVLFIARQYFDERRQHHFDGKAQIIVSLHTSNLFLYPNCIYFYTWVTCFSSIFIVQLKYPNYTHPHPCDRDLC